MAKTRSMTRRENHDDDAPKRKRLKACDNGGGAPWSDLDHDVLFLIMMQLGFSDFLGFNGVCKSWRSLAVSNKKKFLASKPPMVMYICYRPNENECRLLDSVGRKYKTPFPRAAGRCCFGITCGYVILFSFKTQDFWLVNPVTSHELHFPSGPPIHAGAGVLRVRVRGVLVFSPSISKWVFVMAARHSDKIWYSIPGTGAWNHVSSNFPILDLHDFKGKIYTLHSDYQLCEMTLNLDPKLTLLEIDNRLTLLEVKNRLKPLLFGREFASAGENHLYVIDWFSEDRFSEVIYRVQELDFGKMKWVVPQIEKYAFFHSTSFESGAAIDGVTLEKHPLSRYKIYDCFTDTFTDTAKRGPKVRLFATQHVWYFPHECMNVDFTHGR